MKISYAGLPSIKIDPDKHWQDLKSMPIQDQRESVTTVLHFLFQIHEINLPQKIKERFLQYYCDQSAIMARDVAFKGLTEKNRAEVLLLVSITQSFIDSRNNSEFADNLEDGLHALAPIGFKFAEIIEKRDVAALRRIINIIESKGASEGSRGGIGSEDGCMLEKFCDLHLATRSLPTKKALRDACGLGAREDEKLATKRMKKLGLWGLPTEPEI